MMLCYLVGYPAEHSASPAMHNACFRALGLRYEHRLAPVKQGELATFMGGAMKHGCVKGCNVTIPYKVEIIGLLDEVDEAPEAHGHEPEAIRRVLREIIELCVAAEEAL